MTTLIFDDFEYEADNANEVYANSPAEYDTNPMSAVSCSTVTTVNNGAASPRVGDRCLRYHIQSADYGYQSVGCLGKIFQANTWGTGHIWLQFWIYVARAGSELSCWCPSSGTYYLEGTKWVYFDTRIDTPQYDWYPIANLGQNGFKTQCGAAGSWDTLVGGGCTNIMPYLGNNANLFLQWRVFTSTYWDECCDSSTQEFVPQTARTPYIAENHWNLVKQHFYMHPTDGEWQAWIDMDTGSGLQECAHWTNWDSGQAYQHLVEIKLGPVWPDNGSDTHWANGWVYIDDFCLATTEGDLPTYGASSVRNLFLGRGDVRVIK